MTARPVAERALRIISPADLPGPSGGTIYNERIARAWGVDIEWLAGGWPFPSEADLGLLRDALLPCGVARSEPVLLDGLIGCAAPGVLREARTASARIVVLVHLPLPAETSLTPHEIDTLAASEAASLEHAGAVIATSRWAAADLHQRYGLVSVHVAEPGTDPSPLAPGSTPPRLVTVAAYSPRKNHGLLIEAFKHSSLRDLPWSAQWVGADPTGVAQQSTARAVAAAGLTSRISVQGPVSGSDLAATWAGADVLLLPSRAETYAMVVAEALACGVPAMVGAGTGAAETLRGNPLDAGMPGLALPIDDPGVWARAIGEWLTSPTQRQAWRDAALHRRTHVKSWQHTAAVIAHVLHTNIEVA